MTVSYAQNKRIDWDCANAKKPFNGGHVGRFIPALVKAKDAIDGERLVDKISLRSMRISVLYRPTI